MASASYPALKDKADFKKIYDLPFSDWYGVGVELNLERHKLDEIKIDYKGDVATQRREMLNHWLNKDHGATYNKLANALIAKNLTQVAKMLVERINCKLEDVEKNPPSLLPATNFQGSSHEARRAEISGQTPVPTPRKRLISQAKIEADSGSFTRCSQSHSFGDLELSLQAEKQQEQYKQQQQELTECKAKNAELQKKAEKQQEQQQQELTECKAKIAEMQKTAEKQQEQYKQQRQELTECKAKNAELQHTLEEQQKQYKQQEQDFNKWKAENAALKEEMDPLRKQVVQFTTDFVDERNEHNCLKLKHKELEQTFENYKIEAENKLQQQAERLQRLQDSEAHLSQQVSNFQVGLNQEKTKHHKLEEEELQTRKILAETFKEDFETHHQDLKAKIDQKDVLLKAAQKQNKELIDENLALKVQMKTDDADLETYKKQVAAKIKQYDAEIEKLQKNSTSSQ